MLLGSLVRVGIFCFGVLLDNVCQRFAQVYLINVHMLSGDLRGLTNVLLHITLVRCELEM